MKYSGCLADNSLQLQSQPEMEEGGAPTRAPPLQQTGLRSAASPQLCFPAHAWGKISWCLTL